MPPSTPGSELIQAEENQPVKPDKFRQLSLFLWVFLVIFAGQVR